MQYLSLHLAGKLTEHLPVAVKTPDTLSTCVPFTGKNVIKVKTLCDLELEDDKWV